LRKTGDKRGKIKMINRILRDNPFRRRNIKYTALVYRNVANFIMAIYLHCDTLNMNPLAI
jgi:hypothetical protein